MLFSVILTILLRGDMEQRTTQVCVHGGCLFFTSLLTFVRGCVFALFNAVFCLQRISYFS